MHKILDLRFVIGVFFTIIGVLLILYYLSGTPGEYNLNKEIGWGHIKGSDSPINLWSGIVFAAFGVLMIVLSFIKDANDELITKD
jgi:hypothetical protein